MLRIRLENFARITLAIAFLSGVALTFAVTTQPAAAQAQSCLVENAMPPVSFQQITVDGKTRRYQVWLPPTYDPSQPTPVVVSFHGAGSNPVAHSMISAWHTHGMEGFITVYPQAMPTVGRWNSGIEGDPALLEVDDMAYVKALLEDVSSKFCVDEDRIFASGYSSGAGFVNRLACQMPDSFAAFGMVSGGYGETPCDPDSVVPIIMFHGTDDAFVPFEGGESGVPMLVEWGVTDLPAVEDAARAWADHNGCAMEPEELTASGAVHGLRYTGCDEKADVILYIVEGGGHIWPDSPVDLQRLLPGSPIGEINHDIDATARMWEFFVNHAG